MPDSWNRREDAPTIVGDSDALRYVMSRVDQVASTEATVLLCGETGTGKELLAHAIHQRSPRRDRPFVVVNCAALPATLIESELFGWERGAFTGAHASQIGRFELAHRGTVFLDEVLELPLELQSRLLRVLQEGQVARLGSPRVVEVDVRIIAATNRDLSEEVRQGRFRRDLYYRLNVFPITLPTLRERRSDIPKLVEHLVNRFGRSLRKRIDAVPTEVMQLLETYDWPGNVRELETYPARHHSVDRQLTVDRRRVAADSRASADRRVGHAAGDRAAPHSERASGGWMADRRPARRGPGARDEAQYPAEPHGQTRDRPAGPQRHPSRHAANVHGA
jgi:transcriptional regulator with GAF, ATPase, and Fis domain